jgi:hypothetical protein
MGTDQAAHYRLDDEQRARIRDCLTKDGLSLPSDRLERLVRGIEASIDHFLAAAPQGAFRDAHDALRHLWKLCHLDKPPALVLRRELQKLPKRAVEHMGRRARVVIPHLFPGETIEVGVFDPPERLAARFLSWANSADDQKLVAALGILSAEGGGWVAGRSRGDGKRSRPQFEPMIMGEVRGTGARDLSGGAPSDDAGRELVMRLALDWRHATGHEPKPGRSDCAGFGDLVHSVYQWLDDSEQARERAVYALRWYWGTLKSKRRRAAPFAEPLVCADCRWVQPGESRDEFFCQKLSIGCEAARDAGQECGPEGLLFEEAV